MEAAPKKNHEKKRDAKFKAEFIPLPGERRGVTEITKNGLVVSRVEGVRPLSLNPQGTVLLVAECYADDDNRQYILRLEKGEFIKKGSRLKYIFGGRYVVKATWSRDGKKITLYNSPALAEKEVEVFAAGVLRTNEGDFFAIHG